MRQLRMMAIALFAIVAFASAHAAPDEPKKGEAKLENKLVGTWKLVSAKYGGEERTIPEGHTLLKHVTPTQFMWVRYDKDGTAYRAAGGPYTPKGDQYDETPEYGFSPDFEIIKGKTHSFKAKIEGNKWYHNGKLSNGLTIEQVWERVERK